jgi:hypothetical protein
MPMEPTDVLTMRLYQISSTRMALTIDLIFQARLSLNDEPFVALLGTATTGRRLLRTVASFQIARARQSATLCDCTIPESKDELGTIRNLRPSDKLLSSRHPL